MEGSVKACAVLAIVALAAGILPAAAYPDRPITLVIPFPPGGSTGYTAKLLAEQLSRALGQPVSVEAKTGNFGINAIKEALAHLKSTSGKLRFGTDFPGTYVDVDFIMLGRAADLKVTIRSANGALAILNDLVEGRIDMAMLNVATASANFGKYKPLAVTSSARLPNLPDVATMTEAGFPGIGTSNWQGLFAARGTAPEIIQVMHKAAVGAMSTAPAREEIAKVNATVVTSESPE